MVIGRPPRHALRVHAHEVQVLHLVLGDFKDTVCPFFESDNYLAPRILVCVVFSWLAVLRIEGCLNSTL